MRITAQDIYPYRNCLVEYYLTGYKRYLGEPMFLNHDIDYVIAGGFFKSVDLGMPINDIDIYPKTPEDKDKLIEILLSKHWVTDDQNRTFLKSGKKIQILDTYYTSVKDLLANFDFRVCMIGYHPKTRAIYKTRQYDRDVRTKRLVYNSNNQYPIKNIQHLIKYINYGFHITAIDLTRILMKINLLDLDKDNVFKEQLMYYDADELLSHYKGLYDELKEDCYKDCVICGNGITGFRDDISMREYGISGMCQECQDSVFE